MQGITKQSHHKSLRRQQWHEQLQESLLESVDTLRKEHPRMGAKKLYRLLQPEGMGRDKFIELLMEHGYGVRRSRNYMRTTRAGHYHYPNLINGKQLTDVNQLWVSDITFFWLNQKWYYLTFITDVYSRKIVGYAIDHSLHAQANIRALRMALKKTKSCSLESLVHHSDRGSQYIHKDYIKLLNNNDIQISMGNKAWENAHAERINGIIKNEYLNYYEIKTFEDLVKKTQKAVKLYNYNRPHGKLINMKSPNQFEKYIQQIEMKNKPELVINY
jgi:transposase InsO family protein